MKFLIISVFFYLILNSCSSPNITSIANELCNCKSLPPLEAENCFLDWEEKYGKVSLSESQRATFDNIVLECMGTKK